jgi:hypothetical protein
MKPIAECVLANICLTCFPVKNGFKQGNTLLPLLFSFALEYATRTDQVNHEDLKVNGTNQLLVYAVDAIILGESVHTRMNNTEALAVASKKAGLVVNSDNIK